MRQKKKSFCFPKKLKLKNKKSFQKVYQMGTAYIDRFAIINIMAIPDQQLKIGFAVGKKLGNAVVRNHTKRLMREAVRHTQYNIKLGYHIVVVARKPLLNSSLNVYYESLYRLIKKAGLLQVDTI